MAIPAISLRVSIMHGVAIGGFLIVIGSVPMGSYWVVALHPNLAWLS
jgi:hypothetical protein